ncbi:MAG TPA: 2-hydroxyacyl-CoA dehydratase family protein [Candidatus Deferrimicrobiaceae bacterium]|nr:2-hydroxyacyl-CoA dehydratase family protein [Candidatus Deferrimicrobiaceae bacterium]
MPSGVEWAFRFASEVSRNPAAAVSRWKSLSGRKAAGCIPIYAPEEVLHAAGMLPVTLWGNEFGPASPAGVPPFVCSVAGGIVSDIRAGQWEGIDAWVFPSTCDTFQNAFEVLFPSHDERPRFPFVFPASADAPGASEYLLDRIEAFREWAGRVSGREVSEGALEKSVRVYNENRRAFSLLEEKMAESPGAFSGTEFLTLARAGMALPKEGHTEILREALARSRGTSRRPRAKIFLTGILATGPVMEALDAAGAAIVGNDLALGNRYYSGLAHESGDLPLSLVRRHFRRAPCPTLHDSGGTRIERLFERFVGSGADRILLLRVRQCEPESGEIPDISDESRKRGIPFLCLDIDLQAEESASARVRIEAFVEMGE